MAFTEFFCRSGGSNLNGGGLASGAEPATTPVYSGVGDSDGTSIFTPSDGSTPASTVTVGDFGSVYVTAGATVAVFIGRVKTVAAGVNGAITFETTAKSGTFPAASAGAHTITCNVGGAWLGPNAAVGFPFTLATNALKNTNGDFPRVNFKNDATYSITAAITSAGGAGMTWQGYSSSAGDGGKAIIDGGTTGASYVLLTLGGGQELAVDFILQNNGATGNASGGNISSTSLFIRCVFANLRGSGLVLQGTNSISIECESYACNQSNTADKGGFETVGTAHLMNCISHDHTAGSNAHGFVCGNSVTTLFQRCIADTCSGAGFYSSNPTIKVFMLNCDAYNCSASGTSLAAVNGVATVYFVNSNFIKNTGYGINLTGGGSRTGYITSCGFGSGTQANSLGTTNAIGSVAVTGSVTYASGVTPWVDPANGDFRINLAAAKGAGRGAFTETATSYAGTVGYPDIGAAQHHDSQRGHTFS